MKMELDLQTVSFLSKLNVADKAVRIRAQRALHDVTDELIRIASEITPLDKGTLTKAHAKKVHVTPGTVRAEVEFSVHEGSFNYATWIHEGVYQHGGDTVRRSGTSGWSGEHYGVGRKYLERPLKGEEAAFIQYIEKEVKGVLGDA